MICPYCNNDVATITDKNLFRCAECKVELHRDFVQKTNVPYISIGLIGDVNHGKTAFLTALFYLLNKMPSMWPGFFFNALDEYSHGLIYKKVAEFEKSGTLQGNTGDNFASPALFKFTNIPSIGDCFISFNDVAGETYKSQAKISGRGRSVAQSDIAIFLVSISDWEKWEYEIQKMLDTYVNAAQHRMQIDLKHQDLIVTLTKGDLLSNKLSAELLGYLTAGAVDYYEKMSLNSKIGSNDIIRSIFTKQAGGFVNMAEKHFKSVSYTIVSSTGAKTAGINSIAPIVASDPKRVLDPFVTLIHFVTSERHRFLKKRAVKVPVADPIIKGESHQNKFGKSSLVPPLVKFAGGAAILIMTVIYFALVSGKSNSSSYVAPTPAQAPVSVAARANSAAPISEATPAHTNSSKEENPKDIYEQGLAYLTGMNGREKNLSNAADFFMKAANQGHLNAQYNLACLLLDGQGVVKNANEAVQWFRKAAKRGHLPSQLNLGALYYNGIDVERDFSEAAKWYKKAAESGAGKEQGEAQFWYGKLLVKGFGVTKNEDEAIKWFRRAAENGSHEAKKIVSRL